MIGGRILSLLYPENAQCVGCGDISGADGDGFCEQCRRRLESIRIKSEEGRCSLCMQPLNASGRCNQCANMAGRIRRATYAFEYKGPAAEAVRTFKYRDVGCLAEWMALQMMRAPRAAQMLSECDVIVCAPMDWLRRNRRGYNQAWLLARELSKRSGIPAQDALQRKLFVKHQAALGREERLRNLKGAIFCVEDFRGRRVLLVDDVRTTGATAVVCAQALREAGAIGVDLLTFAGVQ